jgi:beta-galactosidase
VLLATQYYRPPFPDRVRWREDLREIRATGLGAIYTWATWAWIEREPGRYVFDDFDALVTEAEQAGLQVILTAVAELMPHWIHRVLPEAHMVDHRGRAVRSSTLAYSPVGVSPGCCTDHSRVREMQGRFLETLARRYANAPNLLVWDAWNEFRWPVQAEGHVCYCPDTLAAFRDWLRTRHGDLDALNAAWHRCYVDWEDVEPGREPGGPWPELLAFQEFLAWRTAEHLSFRVERLRAGDPDHAVIAHQTYLSSYRIMGEAPFEQALCRGDDWELARRVDGFGGTHFPAWRNWDAGTYGMRLESVRGAAAGKPHWVCELQGGAAAGGIEVNDPVTADRQQRWIWQAYARGAKAVSFWCWRDEVFGRESAGFGVVGDDGHRDARLAALRRTTAALQEHGDLLDAYAPDPASAGVVFEPRGHQLEWAQYGAALEQSPGSVAGWMLGFERAQIPYDVLSASALPDLARYRLLCLPWPQTVRPAAADALAAWVEQGGTLVVESELDAFDDFGFYRYPGERPLANRLGIRGAGKRPPRPATLAVELDGASLELSAATWLEPLRGGDAETLAGFPGEEAGAAVLRRRVGAGEVVAIGTHAGLAYGRARASGFEQLLQLLAARAGALPPLRCDVGDGDRVQWRTGDAGEARLLFVTNEGPAATVAFHGRLGARGAPIDLVGGAAVRLSGDGSHQTLEIALAAGGAHVVRLDGPSDIRPEGHTYDR